MMSGLRILCGIRGVALLAEPTVDIIITKENPVIGILNIRFRNQIRIAARIVRVLPVIQIVLDDQRFRIIHLLAWTSRCVGSNEVPNLANFSYVCKLPVKRVPSLNGPARIVFTEPPLINVILSADDIDLLTRLAFEGYTQCEIAQQKKQNQKSISRQFQQIRKTLEKCV